MIQTTIILALAAAALANLRVTPTDDHFIVLLDESKHSLLDVDALLSEHALDATFKYQHAVVGFAARLTKDVAAKLAGDTRVVSIEKDAVMKAYATKQTCSIQYNAPWGLERSSTPGQYDVDSNDYHHETNNGAGATVFVIDTGVRKSHKDFQGRVSDGYDATGEGFQDDNGHGTHCMGTAIGAEFGIAKAAKGVNVKVLGKSGSGSTSGVIAGVDYVAGQCSLGTKCVINMSLGGGASSSMDRAVSGAASNDVVVVVAGGNDNKDACSYSPARSTAAFTVGATSEPPAAGDHDDPRATFSNYGNCLNIFAPGVAIESAWMKSDTDTNTISGTSMAAPHVAGAAAVLRSQNPTSPEGDIQNMLITQGTANTVKLACSRSACNNSPNVMLYTGC